MQLAVNIFISHKQFLHKHTHTRNIIKLTTCFEINYLPYFYFHTHTHTPTPEYYYYYHVAILYYVTVKQAKWNQRTDTQ